MKSMQKGQEGVVLFLSLVMLLMLTILGVSSVQTTSLQQRMATSANDSNLAFQSAEAALRDGEDYLETLTSLLNFDAAGANDNGLYYDADPAADPNWQTLDWSGSTGFRQGTTTGVAVQPRYIIEHVKTVVSDADALNLDNIGQDTGSGRTQIFRITARGTGGTASAQTMIQSSYGVRF